MNLKLISSNKLFDKANQIIKMVNNEKLELYTNNTDKLIFIYTIDKFYMVWYVNLEVFDDYLELFVTSSNIDVPMSDKNKIYSIVERKITHL